ncbi:hypothetical protein NE237_001851 [Protea cynaroides]|uniref:ENTH domain-containing protein n=1 Tax=Protea cynaroides TaxID=273540 RepID=A0A9Q0KU33_9MAGN|nr:hypothetical protein NE237_001851 [Protea cynaroides]
MPSKLRKAIGAVKDQTSIGLALVTKTNSSNLEIAVLKATTHDTDPVDEKYVNEVLTLTASSKHYAASCAQAIAKRIGRTRNWIVALKSLMLVLRIFQDGDPYFPREVLHAMKRGAKILNLSNFRDDSNSSPWDHTAFVRTFALYLDERLECFLKGKLQRRAVYKKPNNQSSSGSSKGRRNNEPVCDMKPPMLLDRISYWQRLLDRAVATKPTGAAKSNSLVQLSLYSIVSESFDLYRDISDALALLLDSFFHLQYQSCVDAFQACIKASNQFEELSEFYTLCKSIGVGRTSEYPSVQKISEELIDTLREFLKDQASFPCVNPRPPLYPGTQLLLPGPSLSPPPQSDCSASTFEQSDDGSELYDRRASLEDLFSVTDAATSRSISTDLDQYDKQFQMEDFMGLNLNTNEDAGPVNQRAQTTSEGQDLVLFIDEYDQQPSVSGESGREGWELVLGETSSDTMSMSSSSQAGSGFASFDAALPYNLFDQAPEIQVQQHIYNPFLLDTNEAAGAKATTVPVIVGDAISSVPTFQAITPTFCAQKSEDGAASKCQHAENDPFASLPPQSDQILGSSTNQQPQLLREQQLWLQNQNKIIAKHANIT